MARCSVRVVRVARADRGAGADEGLLDAAGDAVPTARGAWEEVGRDGRKQGTVAQVDTDYVGEMGRYVIGVSCGLNLNQGPGPCEVGVEALPV